MREMRNIRLVLSGLLVVLFYLPVVAQDSVGEDSDMENLLPMEDEESILEKLGDQESPPVTVGPEEQLFSGEALGSASNIPQEYIIQTGDTLWDICENFLGNPWYWPKLWSLNQYIKNPHLIFPGDRIRFFSGSSTQTPRLDIAGEGSGEVPSDESPQLAEPEALPEEGEPEGELIVEEKKKGIRLESLVYILEGKFNAVGKITHSGEEKRMLSVGDKIYVKFNAKNPVNIGDRYHVVEKVKKVANPDSIFGSIGTMIRRKAVIQIADVHERVVEARVIEGANEVVRDDPLLPYTETVRTLMPFETDKEISGEIVEGGNEQFLVSNQDYVFVNLGKNQGAEDGMTFMVVRRGDGVFMESDKDLPFVVVGKIMLVETGPNSSTAYVTDLVKSLSVGDKVVTVLK